MLIYALIAFAIAAVGDLILAAHVVRGKFAPWALSLLHAAFGALGPILLITLLVQGAASQTILIGFVLLLVAALGGFFLASFHLRQKAAPKAIVVVHAGVAVVGFLTVLSQVFLHAPSAPSSHRAFSGGVLVAYRHHRFRRALARRDCVSAWNKGPRFGVRP
nr:hypothetical protein [Mesorhizobium sp.]